MPDLDPNEETPVSEIPYPEGTAPPVHDPLTANEPQFTLTEAIARVVADLGAPDYIISEMRKGTAKEALDRLSLAETPSEDLASALYSALSVGFAPVVEPPSIKFNYPIVPVVQDPEDYSYSYAPGYESLASLGHSGSITTSIRTAVFVVVNGSPKVALTKRIAPIYGTTNQVLFYFIPESRDYGTNATTGYKITKNGSAYELEPVSIKYDVYNRSAKSFSGGYSAPSTDLTVKLKLTINPGAENEVVYEPAYCMADATFGDPSQFSRSSDGPKVNALGRPFISQSGWAATATPKMSVYSGDMGSTRIDVAESQYLGYVYIDGGDISLGTMLNLPEPQTDSDEDNNGNDDGTVM